MGSMIDFKRPDGSTCKGYLTEAGKDRPSIVVLQEWWGLNDQICGVADRFARAGYNALAPDLYKGRVTQKPDEANHMMSGLDFVGASDQDIAGAVKHLAANGRKVGVMGFCMGGALTIAACARVDGISCGVPFYGVPPSQLADPAKIKVPVQGHFANKDDWCTPQAVNDFEAAMKGGGIAPEIHRYDALHAFANERSPAYDVTCANLAWERMLAFLGKTL
ncbi:MAG: dienelactone hydrolase family protein [Alphaproteobacteria bacterium]|nr:dienelactone hydrolase family protein [Alphaproteobacteria bacterium]